MNHRGSNSFAKFWRHRHPDAHLSTKYEQHYAGMTQDGLLIAVSRELAKSLTRAMQRGIVSPGGSYQENGS